MRSFGPNGRAVDNAGAGADVGRMILIYVALGGAVGAALRYLVVSAVAFPVGTLVVNVVGSFAMGVLFAVLLAGPLPSRLAAFAMTGVLGGFTTFSAFSLDVVKLIEDGRIGAGAAYVLGSVLLSVGACFAGLALARGIS